MVVTVGINDPLQVLCPRGNADKTEAPVKHDVVEEQVSETVEGDAEAAGCKRRNALFQAEENKEKGKPRKEENKEIVLLKSTAFTMVVLMQDPEKAVHDVFMRKPGDPFP